MQTSKEKVGTMVEASAAINRADANLTRALQKVDDEFISKSCRGQARQALREAIDLLDEPDD